MLRMANQIKIKIERNCFAKNEKKQSRSTHARTFTVYAFLTKKTFSLWNAQTIHSLFLSLSISLFLFVCLLPFSSSFMFVYLSLSRSLLPLFCSSLHMSQMRNRVYFWNCTLTIKKNNSYHLENKNIVCMYLILYKMTRIELLIFKWLLYIILHLKVSTFHTRHKQFLSLKTSKRFQH